MTTEQIDLAVGQEVHQLVFIIDMDETVLLTTLDPSKVANLLSLVKEHDGNVPDASDIEGMNKWDEAHPLAPWRKELTYNGRFNEFLSGFEGATWENSLFEAKYTLE